MEEKRTRTPTELQRLLDEQIVLLTRSTASYDAGYEAEAKRMAVGLRILFHDTGRSKSLLGQLGRKRIWFWDLAAPDVPGNLLPHGGLVGIRLTSVNQATDADYVALLDDVPHARQIPFEKWWTAPVFRAGEAVLTREKLVLTAADQDGGAHVDPALNEAYARFQHDNALGWELSGEGGSIPLNGAIGVALRQMTHEVLRTLRPNSEQAKGPPPKAGRNDPCPCRSGKKYKRCCSP